MAVTAQNFMNEISNRNNWKKTHKKLYEVYVCMPKLGTKVTNRLEGAYYETNENKRFVISGTVGETWVIDEKKLMTTYCFLDDKPITPEELKNRTKNGIIDWMHLKTITNETTNWAFYLPASVRNLPVKTSWGDVLLANRDGIGHGKGDFLVCSDAGGRPNLNDMWVVNGNIFPTTYSMKAFPNFGLPMDGKETPKPASIAGCANKHNNEEIVKLMCKHINQVYPENKSTASKKSDSIYAIKGSKASIKVNFDSSSNAQVIIYKKIDGAPKETSRNIYNIKSGYKEMVIETAKLVKTEAESPVHKEVMKQFSIFKKNTSFLNKIDFDSYRNSWYITCSGGYSGYNVIISYDEDGGKLSTSIDINGGDTTYEELYKVTDTDLLQVYVAYRDFVDYLKKKGVIKEEISDSDAEADANKMLSMQRSIAAKFGFTPGELSDVPSNDKICKELSFSSPNSGNTVFVTFEAGKKVKGVYEAWIADYNGDEIGALDVDVNDKESVKKFFVICKQSL